MYFASYNYPNKHELKILRFSTNPFTFRSNYIDDNDILINFLKYLKQ